MPRDHARINLAIWNDQDFRNLSPAAQHLYFVLATHASLSYCGVVDWRPARISGHANGWTSADVSNAAQELSEGLFIVADDSTEEVLLRSWIKHDGLVNQAKLSVSVARAYGAVSSRTLRGVVVHELRKLHDNQPNLVGWSKSELADVLAQPSINPQSLLDYPETQVEEKSDFGTGLELVSDGVTRNSTCVSNPPTPAPTPSPAPSSPQNVEATGGSKAARPYPPEFEEFWKAYPIRRGKGKALAAWKRASKRVSLETILDGAKRYANDPNRQDQFTKYAEGWLNADGWEDDPLPSRDSRPPRPQSDEAILWGAS